MGVPVIGGNWDSDDDVLASSMLDRVAIWRMVMVIFFVLIFIVSTVLNTLFLVFFVRKPALRNISNRFICSLTVCNLVTAWLLLPVVLMDVLYSNVWPQEPQPLSVCLVFNSVADFTTSASVFCTTLISLDRFFAITAPFHYRTIITKWRSWLLITCGWIMALLSGGLSVIVTPSSSTWNVCEGIESQEETWHAMSLSIGMMMIGFCVPFGILLWAYAHIYKAAQQNSEKTRRNSICSRTNEATEQSRPAKNVSRTPSTRSTSSQIVSTIRRRLSNASLFLYKEEARAAKISIGVVILFIVCWLPYYTLKVTVALLPEVQLPPYIFKLTITLTYLNTVTSPYMYIYRSKRIKKEVWKLLGVRVKSDHEKKYQPYQQLSSNLEVPSLRSMYSDKVSYISTGQINADRERKQNLLACYMSQQILCDENDARKSLECNSTSSVGTTLLCSEIEDVPCKAAFIV